MITDEANARSKRLSPYMATNRYTGTLNDPFMQAQSNYMGPEWGQYFGALQKIEEDAKDAGHNYRVDWSGFGNTTSEQESGMPRRRGTLADLSGGGRLSDADARRQFDADVMDVRVGQLGLAAMQRQDQAERDAVQRANIDRMRADEEQLRVASAFAPPIDPHLTTPDVRHGYSGLVAARPDLTAPRPTDRAVLEQQIGRLPANHPIRVQMEANLAKQDAADAATKLAQTKAETERTKAQTEAAAGAPFKTAVDATGKPMTGMALLESQPPQVAATVKAVLEGRQALPTGTALKDPYWKSIVGLAQQADPTFDAVNYNARSQTRTDFTKGKAAGQINAINTAVGHLHDLAATGDKLGNTGLNWVNSVYNTLTPGGTERGVALNNFNTLKEGVGTELMRVWRQVGAGSEKEIEDWKRTISDAKSPEELRGAFSTIGGMLESKLDALDEQYKQGMGTREISAISHESRSKLNALQGGKRSAPSAGGKGADPLGIR